jgi:hypothetical protein
VEHGIDRLRERPPQAGRVGQIACDQSDRQAPDRRQIRGRAVQGGDLLARRDELLDQIAAKEPGAAGDEGPWHVATCWEIGRVA